jgi:LysM repeat protein
MAALLCALALGAACPARAARGVAQANPDIALNENFEGAFANDASCADGVCLVPQNWRVWFIPHRETDPQGINYPPVYAQTNEPARVRSGAAAQRMFTENKTFTAGIYRVVTNIKVGSRLRFTAWGQVWSTNDNSPISARPSTDIRLKIGVDAMAEGDGQPSPFNGRVVWSPEQDAKDVFAQFSIEVEAKSSTVVVWTYATMKDVVRHNEVFWDDAVLEVIAPPPGLGETAPVTASAEITGGQGGPPAADPAAASAAPVLQASPGVTYTVQDGDTLYGIALEFGKDVQELLTLNKLDQNAILSIGQVIIIEPAVQGAAPPPPVAPAEQPPPDPGNTVTATVPANSGSLCVQAYFDNNGDGARDPGEDPVPNVLFTATAAGVVAGTYTTDGVNEPYCFLNLAPGAYIVSATILPTYVATSPLNDTVNVSAGMNAPFSVGIRRADVGYDEIVLTPTSDPNAGQSGGLDFGGLLLTLLGAVMILGALGVGALLFTQGRRL